MKKFHSCLFICLVLFIFSTNIFCASTEFQDFKQERDIHSKSRKALVLWEWYVSNSIDSLNVLGVELLKSAKQNDSDFGISIANRILGCYDVRTGKIDRGIRLLTRSKNYFISRNDNELICESMNELGIAYFLKGDLETAKSFFRSSIKFGEESPVETNRFLAQINLAKAYAEQGRNSETIFLIQDYIKKAYSLKKWEAVSNGYSQLGDLALEKNQIRTARNYFEKQIKYAKKAKSSLYITRAMINQAILVYFEGNTNESFRLFQEVLTRRKNEKFAFNIYEAYFNLARFYYPDNLELSWKYIDSCFKITRANKLLKQEFEIYDWKYKHYKAKEYKGLVDSMKVVISDLEKRNERVRKKIEQQKVKHKNRLVNSQTWIYSVFGIIAFIFLIRYYIIRKSAVKLN